MIRWVKQKTRNTSQPWGHQRGGNPCRSQCAQQSCFNQLVRRIVPIQRLLGGFRGYFISARMMVELFSSENHHAQEVLALQRKGVVHWRDQSMSKQARVVIGKAVIYVMLLGVLLTCKSEQHQHSVCFFVSLCVFSFRDVSGWNRGHWRRDLKIPWSSAQVNLKGVCVIYWSYWSLSLAAVGFTVWHGVFDTFL